MILMKHWYLRFQANQANIVEDYDDVEEESVRECSQLFLYGTSPLRDCFHVIDPHPYFTHCIQGHTHPAFSEHDLNSPCTAVASYSTQCSARHITLPDLDKCKNGRFLKVASTYLEQYFYLYKL